MDFQQKSRGKNKTQPRDKRIVKSQMENKFIKIYFTSLVNWENYRLIQKRSNSEPFGLQNKETSLYLRM